MCGILGIEYRQKTITQTERELFSRALDSIQDRGRDTYTYHPGSSQIYGYVRLPTDGLTLSVGARIKEESYPILLYNGIVNNIDEVKKILGRKFSKVESDHHLLRAGLMQYGPRFLQSVRGMFAFAYVFEGEVVLARDSVGIKPMYYFCENGTFGFASEMKALVPYKPSRIHEVKPGQIIVFKRKNFSIKREFFTYRQKYTRTSLQKLLYESLIVPTKRYFAQSTKNVGLLLSGGLDSSVLCALLHKYLSPKEFKRIRCFCVGTVDADDRLFAQQLAKKYHIPLRLVYPKSNSESLNALEGMVYKTESPYARVIKVAFLQDELAKVISKEGIDVVISGEGADELFYGYRKFIEGLKPSQVDTVYRKFFKDIFYRTLLQRLDRTFAKRCIESRVPFLDQELVLYGQNISVEEKLKSTSNGLVTKVPLRRLAKSLDLPASIVNRKKTTMTLGATLQENKEDDDGYLELFFKKKIGVESGSLVKAAYMNYFGRSGKDILSDHETDLRAEEFRMVRDLRRTNTFKSKILL